MNPKVSATCRSIERAERLSLSVSICAWCQKLDVRSFTFGTATGDSKSLCSEICFNQYRRASFKKNKISETIDERKKVKKHASRRSIGEEILHRGFSDDLREEKSNTCELVSVNTARLVTTEISSSRSSYFATVETSLSRRVNAHVSSTDVRSSADPDSDPDPVASVVLLEMLVTSRHQRRMSN